MSKRKKKLEKEPIILTPEEQFSQMERLASFFERMRIAEYVTNFNRPLRLMWLNFLSGIAKGVGLTIGATLVIAIIFKLLGILISMNIPYLTDILQDVVKIVKATPGLEKVQSLTLDHHLSEQQPEVVIIEPQEVLNGSKSN